MDAFGALGDELDPADRKRVMDKIVETEKRLQEEKIKLEAKLGIPVVDPFKEADRLIPVIRKYLEDSL